jgi:hypothetical protein
MIFRGCSGSLLLSSRKACSPVFINTTLLTPGIKFFDVEREFRVTPSGVMNCQSITPEGVTLNPYAAVALLRKESKQAFEF